MLLALGNGVKSGTWYSLIDKVYAPKTLRAAWIKVQRNKGAAGMDGQSTGRFAAKVDLYLAELSRALREGTYQPQAVKRVDIPKGDGRTRPLGIPTVKDRVVQQAVRLVIEPIFETAFCDGSYGFRVVAEHAFGMTARVPRRVAEGRSADQGWLLLRGGCRPAVVLRHDPA